MHAVRSRDYVESINYAIVLMRYILMQVDFMNIRTFHEFEKQQNIHNNISVLDLAKSHLNTQFSFETSRV